jgi:hypothetical protein
METVRDTGSTVNEPVTALDKKDKTDRKKYDWDN